LEHLGGQDDVRVGDLVETGAGGRSFPSGVPVGRVIRLARLDGGLRLQAEVEPAANLSRLEGLYVWVGDPRP
jgi:rod shape-determining protein MreC